VLFICPVGLGLSIDGKSVTDRIPRDGCILFVTLSFTGKHAFTGSSAATVITAVTSTNPRSLKSMQPVTPLALDHLINTCLAKDPEERRESNHEVLVEVHWVVGATASTSLANNRPVRSRSACARSVPVTGLRVDADRQSLGELP